MRFYLDENFPPGVLSTIALIHDDHDFRSWQDEGLKSMLDVPLFQTLRERSFDVLVTRDRSQLTNPEERAALVRSGLVWVGLRDVKLSGREKLATTAASLIAGLGHVASDTRDRPLGYMIHNVPHQRTQRIKTFPLVGPG